MKRFLKLVLGDLGLIVSSIICAVISFALLPLFLQLVAMGNLPMILAWILLFPFLFGFYGSSVLTAGGLTFRKILEKGDVKMRLLYIIPALIVLIFDVTFLLIYLL